MQSPEKLRVFVETEELTILIYGLTRAFPTEERYALAQQMRRAAVSIGSNIAVAPPAGYDRAAWRAQLAIAPDQTLVA